MFGLMRNFYRWCRRRKEKVVTVAVLGIDNAGKSTLLCRLKGETQDFVTPTVGFSSDVIKHGPHTLKVFDLGGGASIRGIWPRYFAELHAAMYVVDASDKNRLHISREVLHQTLDNPRFAGKPVLIFANKQDKGAMTSAEIANSLGLEKFKGLQYNITTCTAILEDESSPPDPQIQQGLKWLTSAIDSCYSTLQKRIQKDIEERKEEDRIEKEEKRKRIEAARRERELERERREKEEQQKEKEREKMKEKAAPSSNNDVEAGGIPLSTIKSTQKSPRAPTPRTAFVTSALSPDFPTDLKIRTDRDSGSSREIPPSPSPAALTLPPLQLSNISKKVVETTTITPTTTSTLSSLNALPPLEVK